MKKNLIVIISIISLLIVQSCGINSNLMLKTHKDYAFADVDSLNVSKDEYRIDVNDILEFRFFTNNGRLILDMTTSSQTGQNQNIIRNNNLSYIVQKDSLVNLPTLGKINLVGLSIREAETFLAEEYGGLYVNPFIQISVTNKRVIVFPGNGGDASVLYLANNNTTLMEAIALAGGIAERGRASKIKLIRKDEGGKREVYRIDLSTIDGLQYTDILVRANDYIYIEPVPEIGKELLKEIAPIVSLISSAAIVISVINAVK
ncbi:polysaccharide biosynthesis/export family protein [Crocinitomix sp.]|nr:polysaccharide biosynthesis/export family protein [Crocinitomix sp.]